jgi:23S rRNA-/tRNA-specific pseudouridylate synthase
MLPFKSYLKLKKWSNINQLLKSSFGIEEIKMKQMLESSSIRVNGTAITHNLHLPPNAGILIFWRPSTYLPSQEESWNPIVAIEKDYIVTDKIPSLPTIPTIDNGNQNFMSYLKGKLPRHLSCGSFLMTSRLDAGTHGLLMFARSAEFQGQYNTLLQTRKIKKHYQAVVIGWKEETKVPLTLCHYLSVAQKVDFLIRWKEEIKVPLTLSHYLSAAQKIDFLAQSGKHMEERETEDATISTIYDNEIRIPSKVSAAYEKDETHQLEAKLIIKSVESVTYYPPRDKNNNNVENKLILNEERSSIENGNNGDNNQKAKPPRCLPLRAFDDDFIQKLMAQESNLKLLTIELITGRTHQIRSQLEKEGLYIVGDWLYNTPTTLEWVLPRRPLALCCSSLEFQHPITKEQKSYFLE